MSLTRTIEEEEEVEVDEDETPDADETQDEESETEPPEQRFAQTVVGELKLQEPIDHDQLVAMANEAWGGTQEEGAYTLPLMYDALETAVNMYILEQLVDERG